MFMSTNTFEELKSEAKLWGELKRCFGKLVYMPERLREFQI